MLLEVAFAMCATTWTVRRESEQGRSLPGHLSTNSLDPRICGGGTIFQYVDVVESRTSRSEDELKYHVLRLLTQTPGMDDVELADALGEIPFEVSRALRKLAQEGMIEGTP